MQTCIENNLKRYFFIWLVYTYVAVFACINIIIVDKFIYSKIFLVKFELLLESRLSNHCDSYTCISKYVKVNLLTYHILPTMQFSEGG